jgi:hypothetical protein
MARNVTSEWIVKCVRASRFGGMRRMSSHLSIVATVVSCGGNVVLPAVEAGPDSSSFGSNSSSLGSSFEGGPVEASFDTDAASGGSCMIDTGNYDQSCVVDSDCVGVIKGLDSPLNGPLGGVGVQSGDYCSAMCTCGGGAIAKTAVQQYVRDVAATPLGSGAISPLNCGCTLITPPCCRAGRCMQECGSDVTAFVDAGAEEPDAQVDGSVLCGYSDGVLDSGIAETGASRLCVPPETCTLFNGGWECCTVHSGLSVCAAP